MSVTHPAEEVKWSWSRWGIALLVVLATHISFVWWQSARPLPRGHSPFNDTRVLFSAKAAKDHSAGGRNVLSELTDPARVALPHPKGISGAVWLHAPRFSYVMPEPRDSPRWLGPLTDEFLADFDEFIQTNLVFETVLSKPLTPPLAELRGPRLALVPAVQLKVEGELAARSLLPEQPLPQNAEPRLADTVVRVLVDGEGKTVSTMLVASCGSSAPDQAALDFARKARFTPLRRPVTEEEAGEPPGTFGTLTFKWSAMDWVEPGSLVAR